MPLHFLSNLGKTLERPLINCEINLNLTWPEDFAISFATGELEFKITETKTFVTAVTLSITIMQKTTTKIKIRF